MVMPGRSYSATSQYRYGFNGQENSDEIFKGSTTALYWEYDSRIGRRWNIDPAVKVAESPYAAFANNPIWFTDHNGADTTLPSADGGSLRLPDGVNGIKTFDAKKTYSVAGKQITPASGGVLGFTYNDVNYTAQYNTEDQAFAYYLGTDGSKLGYDINTIPSNVTFTGGERLATAGTIGLAVPRTPLINRVPPAYVIGGAIATGAVLSALYKWDNISNNFELLRPLPFAGHGNRIDNSNPHMLYEYTFTPIDGRTPVLKYGIADMFKTGTGRPDGQMPLLMAMYGPSVKWKPLTFTPNRASALAAEQAAVSAHVGIYNEMPRAQILPKPN